MVSADLWFTIVLVISTFILTKYEVFSFDIDGRCQPSVDLRVLQDLAFEEDVGLA